MAGLTHKQQLFVDEYLKCFNATEAARRAGYRGNENTLGSVGWENMQKPAIAEKIAKRLQESAMSADEVLSRLAEQARADHTQYLKEDGTVDLPRLIKDGYAHLIKSTKWDSSGRLIVDFYDAQSALALLGKHHKLFAERMEHTGKDGGDIILHVVYDEPEPDRPA